jgi:hypothetical protein
MVLKGHHHATWAAEFSRETNLLASASSESVRIWTLLPALAPSELSAVPDRFGGASVVSRNGPLTLRTAEGREISLIDTDAAGGLVDAAFSQNNERVLIADKRALKLYDLRDSSEPIARFNVPRGEWRAVGFLRNPDRIVGETNDGKFYTWPFFKNIDALIKFACGNLPVDENGRQTELTLADQERFGLSVQSRACPLNSVPGPR